MKKTSKTAKVSFEFQKSSASELCTSSDGSVTGLTGNAFITTVPVPVATITTQTATVRADMQKIASGITGKAITAQLAQHTNTLMISLISNGHSVQDQANTIAAGDYKKAQQIILSTGYKLAKEPIRKARDFEIIKSDPGTAHVHVKKTKKGIEGHMWKYGLAPSKNSPPTVFLTRFTMEADIIISDLPSGSIVGVQHASVVPVSHNSNTGTVITESSKKASSISQSKAKHPVFSHNTSDPYQWTNFIYTVIL
jgi:hypothetical protein